MCRPLLMWMGAAGLGSGACIDNPNAVGSIGAGGTGGNDNPVVIGGGGNASAGNSATGGGNAPGMGAGGASDGSSAVVSCRANGQQIQLSKACQRAEDCILINGTGAIVVAGAPVTTSCTTLYVGINGAEEARFAAFSDPSNCPPPVGCGPNDLKVQTEDGLVLPNSVVPAVRCDSGICRSYAP